MHLKIHQFPCRSDNYGFLAHDTVSGLTASIDTPDADAVNAGLEENNWRFPISLIPITTATILARIYLSKSVGGAPL